MAPVDAISASAVLAAAGYYLFAWILIGRDPKKGTVIPLYEPPRGFSPAMVRYTWKEQFDDRTLWASALSLVAKGLVTMEADGGQPVLRPNVDARHFPLLPTEERLLLQRVLSCGKRKGMLVNMLDEDVALVVGKMADSLRQAAVGRWFRENRNFVVIGIMLSVLAVGVAARPNNKDEWMAFVLGLGVMVPAAFYLFFLTLRVLDVFRSIEEKLEGAVVRRAAMLFVLMLPCVAAISLGGVVLTATFGWLTLAAAGFLTGLSLLFTRFIKARTAEGRVLEDQIEGFRLFLKSVERLPLDREDAPSGQAGSYEKYLP
jgi:Predicted membrane protein (DUF2207)